MRTSFLGGLRNSAAMAGFLALLLAFIGAVMLPGYRLANELASKTATLKVASENRGRPDSMAGALAAVRDRLDSGAYIGQALEQLAGGQRDFEAALAELEKSGVADARVLGDARSSWAGYRALLEPVAGFKGLPYDDSDTGGTRMSDGGRKLLDDARRALQSSRTVTPQLRDAMATIGTRLEADIAGGAATLRLLMIAGTVFACALVALLAYLQWLKARQERAAIEARNQTRDILATVKDGLFLIDSDFRIGKTHSAALSALLGRERFDGMTFEDLLRNMVPEKTLATATKYVRLLWGERANENLIKSINPLAEVEVHIDRGDGGRDVRYLEFDFHRVKGELGVRQVLVTVNDVTSRVLLARELKEAQANSQAQADMLVGILQLDPQLVSSFLDDSNAALGHVNTVLKVPARTDQEFRDKIDQLFREMHRIKGEAAQLGLVTVESRAHSFEDMLEELRAKAQLGGNDFLPLVLRLDELLNHLRAIRELVGRVDGLRTTVLPATVRPVRPAAAAAGAPVQDLTGPLEALAQRIAADQGKKVQFVARGLESIPGDYRKAVRDVVTQLVRNAVVHGIEAADARRSLNKDEAGVLQVEFKQADGGFELVFQDDGAGIVAERVREAAVSRGVITAEQAASLDTKAMLALIFRPGFSTRDGSDRDAGRGVGLDLVLRAVQALGGKVGVATAPGRYTRFRIALPAQAQQGAVA